MPHKSDKPTQNEGRKLISYHNLFQAYIVMKTQCNGKVSQLLDYLENNIVVTLVCGFEIGQIPGKDVICDFLRDTPKPTFESAMLSNTLKMFDIGLVDFKNFIVDSTSIYVNTKFNFPKSFV